MNKTLLTIVIAALVGAGIFFAGTLVNKQEVAPLGAVSNPYDMGPEVGWNGVNSVVVQGDFKDATTTFVGFLNPTGATTTITRAIFKQTGVATTTASYYCGSSYTPSSDPTKAMFTISSGLATSTSWGTMLYNASTTPTTFTPLQIDPNEYINCFANTTVDGQGTAAGITNANNTFAGHFWIEFLVGR